MLGDGWAEVSIRVYSDVKKASELAPILPAGGVVDPKGRAWALTVGEDFNEPSLQVLLAQAEELLSVHSATFEALPPGSQVDLFIGWSPRTPQENVTMSASLIESLGKLGAKVVFDTYTG